MGRVLGIIGGGQLGMMITDAARMMPDHVSKIIVLDPTPGCPASQAGAEQIVADFKDRDAIVALAKKSDIVTYEIESGDSEVLKSVEGEVEINPSPDTLRIIQDKLLQKSFLAEHGIPVPEFVRVDGLGDLRDGLDVFGCPALLKARRDAYDGRGNFKIDSPDQAEKAFGHLGGRGLMLERFVPFRMEVSVIASRSTRGEIMTYPLVENIHEHNILRETIAPARVPAQVAQRAEEIARDVMRVLKGAGVFGIEMFLTRDDKVIINEIAPRVHNSGHHTLQSSKTSQFEQHMLESAGDTRPRAWRYRTGPPDGDVQHTGIGVLRGQVPAHVNLRARSVPEDVREGVFKAAAQTRTRQPGGSKRRDFKPPTRAAA